MPPFLTAYFARIGWKQPATVDIDTCARCIYITTVRSCLKI